MTATEQQDTMTIEDALGITGLTHEAIRLACKKGAATGRPFHAWQPAPRQWAINRASFMEWWQNRRAPKGGRPGQRRGDNSTIVGTAPDPLTFDLPAEQPPPTAPDPAIYFDLPLMPATDNAPGALDAPAIDDPLAGVWRSWRCPSCGYMWNAIRQSGMILTCPDCGSMAALDISTPAPIFPPGMPISERARLLGITLPPAIPLADLVEDLQRGHSKAETDGYWPPVEVQGDNPTAVAVEVWQTADPSRCACPGCGHSRMTKHHYQNGRRRCPTCIIADCQPGAPRCATVPTEDLTMPEVD